MITIFKYPFDPRFDKQTVALPNGAVIRHIGVDPMGKAAIWAQVDTSRTYNEGLGSKDYYDLWTLCTGGGIRVTHCSPTSRAASCVVRTCTTSS